MTFWWKLGIALAVIVAVLDAGYYIRGQFDEAAQADLLRGQIKTANERIEQQNATSKEVEAQLQADRRAFSTLNRKWSDLRAKKDRAACQLDADTIRLLKAIGSDAGSPDPR